MQRTHPPQTPLTDEWGRGLDPMALDPQILRENGHPNRSLRQVRGLFARNSQGAPDPGIYPAAVTSYRAVKAHCLTCAEDAADVRQCRVTSCPFWPYRAGRNPFHASRGRATSPAGLFRPKGAGKTDNPADEAGL